MINLWSCVFLGLTVPQYLKTCLLSFFFKTLRLLTYFCPPLSCSLFFWFLFFANVSVDPSVTLSLLSYILRIPKVPSLTMKREGFSGKIVELEQKWAEGVW